MKKLMKQMLLALAVMTLSALGSYLVFAQAPAPNMSFFISSTGPGMGANLGGLAGADKHCQTLAAAVGSKRTWRAYLSATASGGQPAVNARDRIGKGPWFNSKGVQVAASVDDLHSDKNTINKDTGLTEKGATVNGVGDKPNTHDILTGSNPDGTVVADTTCGNWTLSGEGRGQLGHHDRMGRGATGTSWNSAHPSRGCSQDNLVATGGAGLLYCFATN